MHVSVNSIKGRVHETMRLPSHPALWWIISVSASVSGRRFTVTGWTAETAESAGGLVLKRHVSSFFLKQSGWDVTQILNILIISIINSGEVESHDEHMYFQKNSANPLPVYPLPQNDLPVCVTSIWAQLPRVTVGCPNVGFASINKWQQMPRPRVFWVGCTQINLFLVHRCPLNTDVSRGMLGSAQEMTLRNKTGPQTLHDDSSRLEFVNMQHSIGESLLLIHPLN